MSGTHLQHPHQLIHFQTNIDEQEERRSPSRIRLAKYCCEHLGDAIPSVNTAIQIASEQLCEDLLLFWQNPASSRQKQPLPDLCGWPISWKQRKLQSTNDVCPELVSPPEVVLKIARLDDDIYQVEFAARRDRKTTYQSCPNTEWVVPAVRIHPQILQRAVLPNLRKGIHGDFVWNTPASFQPSKKTAKNLSDVLLDPPFLLE